VLPILIKRFSLNDLEAGYFFPAQFAGSLTGTFLTTYFGRSGKFLSATVTGALLMAVGILLMSSTVFPVCLSGFAINGLGIGLTLPAINLLVLEMAPDNTVMALSILNFCWGAGAVISKPFVDRIGSADSISWPTLALAVVIAAAGLLLAVLPERFRPTEMCLSGTRSAGTKIWSTTLAWIIAAFNFIHVGFETGMGGWLTTYSDRVAPQYATSLLSPTVFYFGFFVAGRAVVPTLFRSVSANSLLIVNLLVVLIGLLIGLTAVGQVQLSIGAAIAGLGTSTVFPTNMSRFGQIFGVEASRRATPFFIAGTLGAAFISWLIGFVSVQLASLRSAMYVLVASIAVLLILQIGLTLRETRSQV
jgi:fucose permease